MADFQDWKLTDWRAGFLMDVGNYTDWPRSPDFHHNTLYCTDYLEELRCASALRILVSDPRSQPEPEQNNLQPHQT